MTYDNPIIKKRFEEKMKRLDKTSSSILISWAINNATNTLTEEEKQSWEEAKARIKDRYPFFIDLYREWMLENTVDDRTNGNGYVDMEVGTRWQEDYNKRSEQSEIKNELKTKF